jgi:hypothetical protein
VNGAGVFKPSRACRRMLKIPVHLLHGTAAPPSFTLRLKIRGALQPAPVDVSGMSPTQCHQSGRASSENASTLGAQTLLTCAVGAVPGSLMGAICNAFSLIFLGLLRDDSHNAHGIRGKVGLSDPFNGAVERWKCCDRCIGRPCLA